ncbi:MAG: DUF2085 domain-containing protein [Actinomycetota bacterium]|nr:DUF2085 domain-containing protein [Actinomycetota bacterium]
MDTFLHWLGYGLCHQLPERSFFGAGVQVPVCARDTGIYAGFVIAAVIIAALDRKERQTEPPGLMRSLLLAGFVLAMVFDGITSYAGLRGTTNEIRLATGLATGWALAAFTVPLLNGQLWERAGRSRVLSGQGHFAVFVGALLPAWAILFYGAPLLGVLYPVLVAVTVIVTFVMVNLVIVCLLPPFERRARRLTDAWLPILLSLGFTVLELAAASYLKYWLETLAGLR